MRRHQGREPCSKSSCVCWHLSRQRGCMKCKLSAIYYFRSNDNSQLGRIGSLMRYNNRVQRGWKSNKDWIISIVDFLVVDGNNSQYCTALPSPPVSVTWKSEFALQAPNWVSGVILVVKRKIEHTSAGPGFKTTWAVCSARELGVRSQTR